MQDIKRPHNSPEKLDGTYYSRHRDQVLDRVKKYQKTNTESRKEYMKKYQAENKKKLEDYRKSYNKENAELQKEYFKKYDRENKGSRKQSRMLYAQTMEGRFSRWKNGAIKRKKDWNLTIEHLKSLPLKCYYTGVDLTFESNKINTISLDRIDSSLGYNPENVVFCMAQINIMKNSMDKKGFIDLCKMVIDHSLHSTTF